MSEIKDPTAPLEKGESAPTPAEGDIDYPGYRPAGRKFLRFTRVPRPIIRTAKDGNVVSLADVKLLKRNPSDGAA